MIVLAHISDLHLDGERRSVERAARVMEYLNALELDAVLVTGDIADHGDPHEYEQARKILNSQHPVLTCPGNHDARRPFTEVLLGERPTDAPVNRVHHTAGAVFLMCDSTVPGEHHGHMEDTTLAWLDHQLAQNPAAPTFVCFHHPPVMVHIPYVDEIRLFRTTALAEIIERHPHVVAVLCGHAHTPASTAFAGRPLKVAPGVASTLVLPWESGDVLDGVVDHDAPPGVAFHILDDDGLLTTHFRPVRPRQAKTGG